MLTFAFSLFAALSPLSQQINAYVQRYADQQLFSGVVLVARHGDVIYERAFGVADRRFATPNATNTKFQIASVSKPITAAAILILADRGKLSLDDPLSKYVSDFPNGDKITVDQLLTHMSGLNDASGAPDYADWSRFPQTTAQLVDHLKKMPPRAAPGAKYSYSNSNYHVLAYIIEKVSGQSYGDFLTANILNPLGMNDTRHRGNDADIVPRLAYGYMPAAANGVVHPPYLDWTSKTGNGSLYSTASDLLKFDEAKLFKPETLKLALDGRFWFRRTRFGHPSVYINGSSPGYKANLERFIDDDTVIVVLSNLYLASPSIISDDIGAIVYGEKPANAPPQIIHATRAALEKYEGTYQFGPDFYVANQALKVDAHDDYLSNSSGSTFVPLANGEFFDRYYWSFIRFEDGKLIYRNGKDVFTAPKQ